MAEVEIRGGEASGVWQELPSVWHQKSRLGVVVIGRNEGQRLEGALRSVLSLGVPFVYVDSRSTDRSVKVARELGADVLVLDDSRRINASRARNEGFEALLARFPAIEFVQFLDGDSVLAPGWLAVATEVLDANPEAAFVCGRLRELGRSDNLFRRLCDMEWHCEPGEHGDCGGIGMIRVSAFRGVGGFDESLIAGADPALYARLRGLGWNVVTVAEAMGTHDSGMESLRQWWTRSVKGGYAYGHARLWGGWRRERLSAVAWGAVLPAGVLLTSALVGPYALWLLLAYPAQAVRIWIGPAKRAFSPLDRWLYAWSCVALKFPQALGVATFEWRRLRRTHGRLIQYK